MICCRVLGKEVELRFSFFAVLAILSWQDGANSALLGLYACLLHEAGHLMVMELVRVPVRKVVFYGAGIRIESIGLELTGWFREALVLVSGCAVNIVIFLGTISSPYASLRLFALMNLSIGIFNLIPVKKFDGGRLFTLLGQRFIPPRLFGLWEWIRRIVAALLIAVMALLAPESLNMSAFITLGYFIIMELTDL